MMIIDRGLFLFFVINIFESILFPSEWCNCSLEALEPLVPFLPVFGFEPNESEFGGVRVHAVHLDDLDLLFVVAERDLGLAVALRQIYALARLALLVSILQVEILQVKVALLAAIESSLLHQDALFDHF